MTSRLQPYFAVCPGGLEAALADELDALGAREVREEGGGVAFNGTRELG
jgi:23S rRNA G2445 N2-methylase RlmL